MFLIDALVSMNNSLLYHLAIAALIVVVFFFLSGFVKRLLSWAGRKIFVRTETKLDDMILDVIRKNVRLLMVIIGLQIGIREIGKGLLAGDETIRQILEYSSAILYVAIVLVLLRMVLGSIRVLIDWYLDQMASGGESPLKMTLGPLTSKIANVVIGLVAVIIILDHFGINIGSLLVSLGVGSLAVALAAQDTLANMIAGFVILVDRPFRVGDRIELPSGQIGDVQQIGLRSTRILNFDNNLIIVPNGELVKGRIINYAYPHNQMRAVVKVGVAYGTEPAKVRSILVGLALNHPNILPEPPPEVLMTAMNDSSMEFSLVARASDFTQRYPAECSLREQAYEAFRKEGVEIPFPQRVVHMKSSV
jgi:small-conductance mechanosensitive channel